MQVERSVVLEILRQCHLFLSLNDEQLEKVADRIEAFLYEENAVIFEQSGEADGFFFVFSGQVKLSWMNRSAEDYVILQTRDYFGEEALSPSALRRNTTASALSEVILLTIKGEDIQQLRREFPSIDLPLRMVLQSYLLATSLKMDWRAPREVVHYIARRHWFFLVLKLLPVMAISGILIGVFAYLYIVPFSGAGWALILFILSLAGMLFWLIWLTLDWSNDYAVVTNRRVVKLEKVLLIYDSRQEIPLDAILADDLKTDQIGRILGYGSILVRTYTGVMEVTQQAHPQLVINLINEVRNRKKYRHRHEQLEMIDSTIRERIEHGAVKKSMTNVDEPQVHFKAGVLQELLSKMFSLRIEEGNTITYRTHWIILLKKIGIPTLLLFISVVFILLIWFNLTPLSASIGTVLAFSLVPFLGLWWIYRYVDWRNDRYVITPEFIMDVYRKPLGTEERKSAPIRNILSIDYERKDIIGLMFNFGTVFIRVGDSTLTFDNVINPAEVQRELFQVLMEYKQREESRSEQERNEQMADWIQRYHEFMEENLPDEPEWVEPDPDEADPDETDLNE